MKICIAYDTRRGSTTVIAEWMKEALESKNDIVADIKKVNKLKNFNYDLFIIGSPIYWEKPLRSVVNFVITNKEILREKKVALFIVCMAQVFGASTKHYIKTRYLKPFEEHIQNPLIESGIFKGWLRKQNSSERSKVLRWVGKLITAI